MELDKEKFHDWLFEKLETLPQFECVEGEISDVVEKYKTYFNFARIQKTGNGKKVWVFKCDSNAQIGDDTWGNYALKNEMIIRIWSDNKKLKLSVEADITTSYHRVKKKIYLHSNPIDFIEDCLEKFSTKSLSNKFGL
jgi:hypothetical protein